MTERDVTSKLLKIAEDGNKQTITGLLNSGADIQAKSKDGSTPLHDAGVENGTGGSVTLLLSAGANIETRTREGQPLCIEPLPMARQELLPPC